MGDTASKCQRQDWDPGSLTPEFVFITTKLCCLIYSEILTLPLKGRRCLSLTHCPLPSAKPAALLVKSTSASPFSSIAFPYQWKLASRLINQEDLYMPSNLVLISTLPSQDSTLFCSAMDQHFNFHHSRRQSMWWGGRSMESQRRKMFPWLTPHPLK